MYFLNEIPLPETKPFCWVLVVFVEILPIFGKFADIFRLYWTLQTRELGCKLITGHETPATLISSALGSVPKPLPLIVRLCPSLLPMLAERFVKTGNTRTS
jgi:hypothetical protein